MVWNLDPAAVYRFYAYFYGFLMVVGMALVVALPWRPVSRQIVLGLLCFLDLVISGLFFRAMRGARARLSLEEADHGY